LPSYSRLFSSFLHHPWVLTVHTAFLVNSFRTFVLNWKHFQSIQKF
jgi:hypothetical protein